MMRVLVTGANGLVGSGICRALLRQGHTPLAVVRSGSNTEHVPMDVDVYTGSILDRGTVRRILAEAQPQAVAHAAAVVSTGRPDLRRSLAVNVDGTRLLCTEAAAAGIAHWLQISSMSAHSNNKAVYGGTKLLQEEVVRESGLVYTIFRPSLVYGPQRRGIFHRLARMTARLPVMPLAGGGHEPMRPVHVDDLCDAVVAALGTSASHGRTYQIGGAEDWTMRDMLAEMRRLLGLRPSFLPVPLPICRIIAIAGEVILTRPPLTSDNLEGIAKARRLDIEPARRELGFSPRPFEEGFADCLQRGLLDQRQTPSAAVYTGDQETG